MLILFGLAAFCVDGIGQDTEIEPMLDLNAASVPSTNNSSVTAVYGVGVEDYLPLKEVARQSLRPNVRKSNSHPAFDLPDAFFFIGGPVFLLIFLRVLVIFLNGFEEKRKEEERVAASERLAGE